jgi:hypothetical protein
LVLLFSQAVPVHAEVPQSIVVIDSGTNTSLFKDSILYEVCLLTFYTCPNGKTTMEGKGSANLPKVTNTKFNHGTQMISVILEVNPSVKVIPIRIVGIKKDGSLGYYDENDMNNALKWVLTNYKKFNIVAVNLSQGRFTTDCTVPKSMKERIETLKSLNIPVLVSVGNNGSKKRVWTPACLPDTVSVGSTELTHANGTPSIATYSNGTGELTDFYLKDRYTTFNLDGTKSVSIGTSNATAALSSWWVLNRKSTFDETFAYLVNTATIAQNAWTTGRYISIS